MRDVIYEMSSKRLGMTCVGQGRPPGGHYRWRPSPAHERHDQYSRQRAGQVMTVNPVTIGEKSTLAAQALNVMESGKSIDRRRCENRVVEGVVHLHDLWEST